MVDALELQLERQLQAALGAKRESERLLTDFRIAERIVYNAGCALADGPEHRERLMLAYGIAFDGRHYIYDRYRYERLVDAVNYARLQHAHPHLNDPSTGPSRIGERVEPPSDLERELMGELGITFEAGVYRLGVYRYDHLSDAVEYARLKRVQ
jgi:hypothetical protein